MSFRTDILARRARAFLKAGQPIPLDLFADLMAAGVDVNEIERTTAQ